ncbi:MAG: YitT family protein [Firmicutes bacterium]|nr:YitT family protein [Bacillota bacterium]
MKIKNVLLNFLGSSLLAFGVCAFIVPSNIIAGGATGISIILHKLTGLDISLITLIFNMTCLPIGYILGSKELAFGSILSSIFYPMALAMFERMPQLSDLSDSIMLSVIFAGVICGAGIGLVMKSGGSTGGTDIPCLLIHKYFHIPVDTVINVTDTLIMLSQIPFSNVTYVLYGLIYTFLMTNTISRVLTFGVDKYRISVVSEQHEEIRRLLLDNDYGVTMLYAQSGYTYTDIQKLETVIPIQRLQKVQKLIESVDETSFITIEKVTDVKGRGFTLEREWLQM